MFDSIEALPYDVSVFIGSVLDLPWLLLQHREFFLNSARLNVALSMWELAVLPELWKRALECFDVLLTPSDFMRYCFAANVGGAFIVSMDYPIDVLEGRIPCRERFGLPADKVLFISSFDPWSDAVRKNPDSIIMAFREGMGAENFAHLVLKLNNVRSEKGSHPELQRLRKLCGEDPRIHFIAESLSYAEVLNLYHSCDVFVSLHRAEGLGLGLMESMALAKPVIATAWSGNMTFMNHTNSCLVGYDLIPVDGGIECYRNEFLNCNAAWAEPHVDEAARWIRTLANDSTLRSEIGKKAACDMARYTERAKRGLFLDEICSIRERISLRTEISKKRGFLMKALNDAVFDHSHNRLDRMGRDMRQLLDRHILWRFRRPAV